jgi:hypothetical protein
VRVHTAVHASVKALARLRLATETRTCEVFYVSVQHTAFMVSTVARPNGGLLKCRPDHRLFHDNYQALFDVHLLPPVHWSDPLSREK